MSQEGNLVSLSEVSRITGLSIIRLTPIAGGHEVVCGYEADTLNSEGAVIIFVISPDASTAQGTFNASKQQATTKGATVAGLSGIGDSACTIVQGTATSVDVLKGSVVFFAGGTTSHPLPLNVDQALAQLVASRL